MESSKPQIAELIQRWREESKKQHDRGHGDIDDGMWAYQHEANGQSVAYTKCADELEAALQPLEARLAAAEALLENWETIPRGYLSTRAIEELRAALSPTPEAKKD